MSGGSMEYLYSAVLNARFEENTAERKAFRKHLNKVATALRAIEWNDSGDGDDNESELIRACMTRNAPLNETISGIYEAIHGFKQELEGVYGEESIKAIKGYLDRPDTISSCNEKVNINLLEENKRLKEQIKALEITSKALITETARKILKKHYKALDILKDK
jgi:predicted RNase H-like nuclease (RuvC/YqgF family)